MTLEWHDIEGEVLLEGDYSRVILQETQRQVLLLGPRNLWICDLDTFEVKHMVALDPVAVHSAQLDPSRQRLYIGTDRGKKLLTIDLHSLLITTTVMKTACRDVKLSPNGQRLYWLSLEAMTIVALDGKKPRAVRGISLKGSEMGVRLGLAPSGQELALARHQGGGLYRADSFTFRTGCTFPEGIHDLAYSPDSVWLASVGGQIHVPQLPGNGGPDYDRISEAYYTYARLTVWDGDKGTLAAESPEHSRALQRLIWHPRLPLIVTDSDEAALQFWSWDAPQKQLLAGDQLHLPTYHHQVRDLTFTRDGQRLLVLSDKGLLEYRLKGVASLRQPQPPMQQASYTVSTGLSYANQFTWHDGHLWISSRGQWCQYDPQSRTIIRVSPYDEHAFQLRVEPLHKSVLRYRSSNSASHRIEIRNFDNELITSVRDIPKGEEEFSPGYGVEMRLEQDGAHLTFLRSGEITRIPINASDQRISSVFETGSLVQGSLNAPPDLAVTIDGFRDVLRLWNVRTMASVIALQKWALEDLAGYVTQSVLRPDGLLALGASKGEVRVYNLTSETRLMRGTRHRQGRIESLAFSSDGQQLASAAEDGTVRLWGVENGEDLAVFVHAEPVQQVTFRPGAQELISIDQSGTLYTWSLSDLMSWTEPAQAVAEVNALPLDKHGIEWAEYRNAAQVRQLGQYAERSWQLHSSYPPDQAPCQAGEDLVEAYLAARLRQEAFSSALTSLAQACNATCKTRTDTGIKDANRSIEKMQKQSAPRRLPTDLLAGTLIVPTVADMYDVAEQVGRHFTVVSFRDRMIHRTKSLYGDLQFSVSLDGHQAEVKIQHQLFHKIDEYEHRLYEIQRSMDAQYQDADLPLAEDIVGTTLAMASRHMYTRAWRWITAREEGLQ